MTRGMCSYCKYHIYNTWYVKFLLCYKWPNFASIQKHIPFQFDVWLHSAQWTLIYRANSLSCYTWWSRNHMISALLPYGTRVSSDVWREHWPIQHFFQRRVIYQHTIDTMGHAAGGSVGCWDNALQSGRSRIRIAWRTFHGHNPSGRTMQLGPSEPLAEMSTIFISWG
jgi:hypothetical protein